MDGEESLNPADVKVKKLKVNPRFNIMAIRALELGGYGVMSLFIPKHFNDMFVAGAERMGGACIPGRSNNIDSCQMPIEITGVEEVTYGHDYVCVTRKSGCGEGAGSSGSSSSSDSGSSPSLLRIIIIL